MNELSVIFYRYMNKLYCLIGMIINCGICNGQNLVPNGDFEQYSGCPNWYSQIDSALFWTTPQIGMASSSDYLNSCANASNIGVPTNNLGFQQAHSGVAYAGIVLGYGIGGNSDWREYIEVPLLSPMIANSCYNFEMYVSLGFCRYTTDDIGVYFSDTIISGISYSTPLPFIPQVINQSGNLFDTLNWTLVSGIYMASGNENYLVIGNFNTDSNTTYTYFNPFQPFQYVYVYIDDVCLSPCSSSCTTSITEHNTKNNITVYPNPFVDKINIITKYNEQLNIIIYDATKRIIYNQSFTNSASINSELLKEGFYIYEVKSKNVVINNGKLVKY